MYLLYSENDKRFLFETTTSHFADRNLAAMEAAIKDLGTRVQQLETENQLEESLVYRLNRELITVQSELNATMYRQGKLTSEIKDFSLSKKILIFFKWFLSYRYI